MTRSIVIAVLALASLAIPSAAWSADMEGKVQAVNATERTVTLDNGTTVWLAESVTLDALKEGAEVKMVYEDKDGKPVASSVEVK